MKVIKGYTFSAVLITIEAGCTHSDSVGCCGRRSGGTAGSSTGGGSIDVSRVLVGGERLAVCSSALRAVLGGMLSTMVGAALRGVTDCVPLTVV